MVDRQNRLIWICLVLILMCIDGTIQQQQFLVSRQDRLALFQLRSSLGLRAREWPLRLDPCVSWAGIRCMNGSVTGINISGFRRTRRGSVNPQFSVDALQNLSVLSSFNASNFRLVGQIPQWLGLRLASLQVLDLSYCSINGSIPYTIGNLSSLAELHLVGNELSGEVPSSLSQLIGLSVLDLSQNSLIGSIPPEIGRMSRLEVLNLSRNSFSSSIPAQLGNLSSLVDLDLGSNLLSGSVPLALRGLRNLRRMMFGNNVLSGQLPGDFFPPLTQLQFVVLTNNRFVGDVPNELWLNPSLQLLDLSGNKFTGLLPNVTSSLNGNTTLSDISGNLFYGNITPVIRKFNFINMSGNYFEGSVPDYARGSTSLGRNCLRNTTSQRERVECATFYTERNLVFDNFGDTNVMPSSPPPRHSINRTRRLVIIYASVFGGVTLGVALAIFICVMLIICRRKRGPPSQRDISVGPIPTGGNLPPPGASLNFSIVGDAFTYQQILQVTGGFNDDHLIKHGHSGDLFRGMLDGGFPVVVKKVDLNSVVKKESYLLELDAFDKLSHPRFVPLLGHCLENENEKFLVYKYLPKGDLYSSLFKQTNSDDSLQSLDWITRLKIAIGAAEGLSYLHHECNPPLVHRDVQASSILLDDKFEVRLGSLSEVCAQEGDPHQNRFTRFLRLPQTSEQGGSGTTPNATCAYDVYCLGKVLLELVTGKVGMSSCSDAVVKEWLDTTLPYISIYDRELVTNIVDPSLMIDDDLLEEVWATAIVARSCLNPKASRRPLMRYILKALENPLKVVREEHSSSARLRATSSRGSWSATLFGSWRHSSSDVAAAAPSHKVEGILKTMESQGSGVNAEIVPD